MLIKLFSEEDGKRLKKRTVPEEEKADMFLQVTLSLLQGFWGTLKLFILTLVFSLPLGLLISLGCMSRLRVLKYPLKFIIWVVRGTPLLLQLLIIFYGPGIILGKNIWVHFDCHNVLDF